MKKKVRTWHNRGMGELYMGEGGGSHHCHHCATPVICVAAATVVCSHYSAAAIAIVSAATTAAPATVCALAAHWPPHWIAIAGAPTDIVAVVAAAYLLTHSLVTPLVQRHCGCSCSCCCGFCCCSFVCIHLCSPSLLFGTLPHL